MDTIISIILYAPAILIALFSLFRYITGSLFRKSAKKAQLFSPHKNDHPVWPDDY